MSSISPDLAAAVAGAKSGRRSMVKCPAHDDGTESLSVAPGATQPVVLHCHAGCTTEAVLGAYGVSWEAISAERETRAEDLWTPAGTASHIYSYRNKNGREVFQVLRIPQGQKKTFRQRHLGPDGQWEWNLTSIDRVLYRLPEVLECARDGSTVYVVEGEKDADRLASLGYCSTTAPGGAGKWLPQFTESIAGSNVIIIADADDPGREHARGVKGFLLDAGCMVEIRESPFEKDISDHLDAGHTLDDLVITSPAEQPKRTTTGVDILDIMQRSISNVEYVIPDVLARGDRLLVTGFEGHGKSTFLRQMAVQVAAGIDPFSEKDIEPRKVMVLDFENHPDQVLLSWQEMIGLARYHKGEDIIQPGMLTIFEEWDNDATDLLTDSGVAWLHERIHAYTPDLVVMGPLTNMAGRDLKDDEVVRKVKRAVNSARSICGTAFVMEHHAPHKEPGAKARSVRPYGSSMFLKWPDFGYGFQPDEEKPGWYEWRKTRFPRVRTRKYPEWFRTGVPNTAEWPWMPATEAEHEIA